MSAPAAHAGSRRQGRPPMEFSATEDIAAPLERVFAEASNFGAIEQSLRRRGIDVARRTSGSASAVGMTWEAGFPFRGRHREATVTLTQYVPPGSLAFQTVSSGLHALTRVDLAALSPGRTRVSVVVELMPRTLSARLLVQSMKLARANLAQKFRTRAADYARDLEDRLGRTG